jgi:FKBP-type peptidyl-prolyl cis-trans isomerase SlyD
VRVLLKVMDEDGDELDDGPTSLGFVHGYGQLVPGLEKALLNARAGERRRVLVEPADGYGEHDPEAVFSVERSELPDDIELDDELILDGPEGSTYTVRVSEITPEQVLLDSNHPLAGERVRFDARVELVRDASPAELERAQERSRAAEAERTAAAAESCGSSAATPGLIQLGRKPRHETSE